MMQFHHPGYVSADPPGPRGGGHTPRDADQLAVFFAGALLAG